MEHKPLVSLQSTTDKKGEILLKSIRLVISMDVKLILFKKELKQADK